MIYTRSGVASITYKGVSTLLTKGSVVVIDCMVLHDYRTISADPWVYDYINQSKMLLANSKLSVEQVAIRVGFSNYSNFANQFKRLTDVTPSAYRSAVIKGKNVRTTRNE